eukprot:TRINITY_DN107_c0_g1_i5.p1 TRINITY_DN107_c0_g1~~TRINITY_DN107_c0_g1_i5.p1  ORF type:complete len:252 (+),score=32.21 TRINITY_DN107_c0_g1_i5:3094-3849(+)
MSNMPKLSNSETRVHIEIKRLEGEIANKRSAVEEEFRPKIAKWEGAYNAAAEAYSRMLEGEVDEEKLSSEDRKMKFAEQMLSKAEAERDKRIEAAVKDLKDQMQMCYATLGQMGAQQPAAPAEVAKEVVNQLQQSSQSSHARTSSSQHSQTSHDRIYQGRYPNPPGDQPSTCRDKETRPHNDNDDDDMDAKWKRQSAPARETSHANPSSKATTGASGGGQQSGKAKQKLNLTPAMLLLSQLLAEQGTYRLQ